MNIGWYKESVVRLPGWQKPAGSISKDGSASNATGSVGYGLVQGCSHGNMPVQLSTCRNLDLPTPTPSFRSFGEDIWWDWWVSILTMQEKVPVAKCCVTFGKTFSLSLFFLHVDLWNNAFSLRGFIDNAVFRLWGFNVYLGSYWCYVPFVLHHSTNCLLQSAVPGFKTHSTQHKQNQESTWHLRYHLSCKKKPVVLYMFTVYCILLYLDTIYKGLYPNDSQYG